MVTALAAIAEEARLINPYVGDLGIAKLRARVETLTESVPPLERAEAFRELGMEELRLGNPEAAVAALSTCYRLRRSGPGIPQGDKSAYYLGLAYMRLAENRNCVARHCCSSCIFPIGGDAIHVEQDPSKEAIKYFTESLAQYPSDLASRWLLNVAYMTIGEYPDGVPKRYLIPPKTFDSDEKFPRFVDIAPRLGLNTFDLAGGVIVDDFDGDGWLDVVVSDMDPSGQLRFFRNNGDGSFTERTEEAGLNGIAGGLNIVQADYDNDGDTDVLVLRGAWLGDQGRIPSRCCATTATARSRTSPSTPASAAENRPSQTAAWARLRQRRRPRSLRRQRDRRRFGLPEPALPQRRRRHVHRRRGAGRRPERALRQGRGLGRLRRRRSARPLRLEPRAGRTGCTATTATARSPTWLRGWA